MSWSSASRARQSSMRVVKQRQRSRPIEPTNRADIARMQDKVAHNSCEHRSKTATKNLPTSNEKPTKIEPKSSQNRSKIGLGGSGGPRTRKSTISYLIRTSYVPPREAPGSPRGRPKNFPGGQGAPQEAQKGAREPRKRAREPPKAVPRRIFGQLRSESAFEAVFGRFFDDFSSFFESEMERVFRTDFARKARRKQRRPPCRNSVLYWFLQYETLVGQKVPSTQRSNKNTRKRFEKQPRNGVFSKLVGSTES